MANYPFVSNHSSSGGPYKGDFIVEDAFFDWLKQYEGSDYYNQFLNAYNTYKGQSFNSNFFQDFAWSAWGDNSPWNNFENSRLTTFYDSLARIQDSMHQENYNSVTNQVELAKNSGINSDLSGSVPSSPAGNLDNLETPTPAPVSNGSLVGEVGSSALQVLTTGMSLAQGFQSLSAGDVKLGLDSLNLFKESEDTLGSILGSRLSESDIRAFLDPNFITPDNIGFFGIPDSELSFPSKGTDDYDNYLKSSDWFDLRNRASNFVSSRIYNILSGIKDDKRLPSSLRRKLNKTFTYSPESADFRKRAYGLIKDFYSNKRDAVESAGHPFTNGGFEHCLDIFGKHIQSTVIDVQELTAKFNTDRLSVRGDSYTDSNGVVHEGDSLGTLAGKSDVMAYSAESYSKEYQKLVDKMWDNILKDLSEDDSWWSSILSFLIPIARSWLNNVSLPSVSHSTSVDSNGNEKSSSSWSF